MCCAELYGLISIGWRLHALVAIFKINWLIIDFFLSSFPVTDAHHAYIIVSFLDGTLVLSIGETVEEVTDSGFIGRTRTLAASRLGEDAFIQVCVYEFACVCVCVCCLFVCLLFGITFTSSTHLSTHSYKYVYAQIHSEGVRHIFADKRISEWRPPAKRHITSCAVNDRQVCEG